MFNDLIRDIFVSVLVPIAGVVALIAIFSGKMKVLGVILVGMAVGAMLVFIPASTVQSFGTWTAQAASQILP